MNDEIPAWAIELIKQVERLNEKIPTHIDWVERNMKDHEMRIRNLERKIWIAAGAAAVIGGFGSSIWGMIIG
jgi:chaperonin cofactor prefoldin